MATSLASAALLANLAPRSRSITRKSHRANKMWTRCTQRKCGSLAFASDKEFFVRRVNAPISGMRFSIFAVMPIRVMTRPVASWHGCFFERASKCRLKLTVSFRQKSPSFATPSELLIPSEPGSTMRSVLIELASICSDTQIHSRLTRCCVVLDFDHAWELPLWCCHESGARNRRPSVLLSATEAPC